MNQEPKVRIGTVLDCGLVVAISNKGVTIRTKNGDKVISLAEVERKVAW